MAIYNTKTKERKWEGCVISERGTFRMDTSMDEIKVWDKEKQAPYVFYLAQCDWYVERGSDLTDENRKEYNAYLEKRKQYILKVEQERFKKSLKKGDEVKVIKGRKVPIGTVGIVFFITDGIYGAKIGILVNEEIKYYTYLDNIERTNGIDFNEAYDPHKKEYVL